MSLSKLVVFLFLGGGGGLVDCCRIAPLGLCGVGVHWGHDIKRGAARCHAGHNEGHHLQLFTAPFRPTLQWQHPAVLLHVGVYIACIHLTPWLCQRGTSVV